MKCRTVASHIAFYVLLLSFASTSYGSSNNALLETRIDKVTLDNYGDGIHGLTNVLRLEVGLPLGFVLAPDDVGMTPNRDQRVIRGASIEELLNLCIETDPRYTWRTTESNRVVIFPKKLLSVLYSPVPDVSLQAISLNKAQQSLWNAWNTTLSDHGLAVHGMMLSLFSEYRNLTAMDRVVFVDINNACALDLFNKAFDAAGPDLSWGVSRGCVSVGQCMQSRVRTVDAAAAEDYLASGPLDQQRALTLLERAIASAPYEALRQYLRHYAAQIYLGPQGMYSGNLTGARANVAEAEKLLWPLVEHPSHDAGVHAPCLDRLVALLRKSGRIEEAKTLLDRLIDSPDSDQYFRMDFLREARIALPF